MAPPEIPNSNWQRLSCKYTAIPDSSFFQVTDTQPIIQAQPQLALAQEAEDVVDQERRDGSSVLGSRCRARLLHRVG